MATPVISIKIDKQKLKNWVWHHPLMQFRPVRMTAHVASEMITRDANHFAAGVAYYAIFGIFPFLLGMMVISGLVLRAEVLQAKLLEFVIGNFPGSDRLITNNIVFIDEHRGEFIILALLGILWSSSSVYGSIDRLINRAWGIYWGQPFHVHRVEHVLFLLSFGLYFFFWLAVNSATQILLQLDLNVAWQAAIKESQVYNLLIRSSSWIVTVVGFLLLYKYVPNCKVKWHYVWLGTIVASALFELGKELFTVYLHHYGRYDILYGSIASTIVFLFWVFLSALILTLGASICSNYQQAYHPDDEVYRIGGWR